MQLRRRIILLGGAAAIAALATQPANANAAMLTCDSFIFPGGGGSGVWTLQFECGNDTGCYYDGVSTYDTFDCLTSSPGGNGCDSQRCFDSK